MTAAVAPLALWSHDMWRTHVDHWEPQFARVRAVRRAQDDGQAVARMASAGGRIIGHAIWLYPIGPAAAEVLALFGLAPAHIERLRGTRSAFLTDLLVVDSARRAGVGTRLVRDVMAGATAAGAERLALIVEPSNTAARRLYTRLGFSETETDATTGNAGGLEMSRALTPPEPR